MTKEQYEHWCDFALRMAWVAYGEAKRPNVEWIVEHVEDFLAQFAEPEQYEKIRDWDRTDGDQPVTDYFQDWENEECGDLTAQILRREQDAHCDRNDGKPYLEEDPPDDPYPDYWDERIQKAGDLAREQWERQWSSPVACCVRAGLDMATQIGGGVVGFTLGTLRRMYPEGIPDFISAHYQTPLGPLADDESIWL